MQQQLGVLRRKLEQKEQLEEAIEGKHSKLTDVYRALESECQAELQKLRAARDGKHSVESEGSSNGDGKVESAAASSSTPPASAVPPCPAAPKADASAAADIIATAGWRGWLASCVGGMLVGWVARGRFGGRRQAPSRTTVEEMRGWMPVTDIRTDMKLS